MVHRPPDSRLLSSLSAQESTYYKHLISLLDTHAQSSLSALAAYASAASPAVSRGIMGVAGSLAGADEALRKYAQAVDAWRSALEEIRQAEEDVGRVGRDREILVTRLIKASKSQKPTRDSFISSIPSTFPDPSHSSSSIASSPSFSTPNTKLSTAQAELQACEAHLAAKEQALDRLRVRAVKQGLEGRCKAMVECGWAWGEMGKEGLRALEDLNESENAATNSTDKPLPIPESQTHGPGSDLSSLNPSQSASQIFLASPPDHGLISPISRPTSPPILNIPAAHSISEYGHPPIPMQRRITEEGSEDLHAAEASSSEDDSREVQVVNNKPFGKASASTSKVRLNGSPATPAVNGNASQEVSPRKRFGFRSHARNASASTNSSVPRGQSLPSTPHSPVRQESPARDRKTSFFGGIAGLFRSSRERDREDVYGPGAKWKTRTDINLRRGKSGRKGADSDSDDETPRPSVFTRRASEDNHHSPYLSSPPRAPATKLKKANDGRGRIVSGSDVGPGRQANGNAGDTGWTSDGGVVKGEGAKRGSVKSRGGAATSTSVDLSSPVLRKPSTKRASMPASTSAPASMRSPPPARSTSPASSSVSSSATAKRTPSTKRASTGSPLARNGGTSSTTSGMHPDAGRGESLMSIVEGVSRERRTGEKPAAGGLFLPTAPASATSPNAGLFLPSASAYSSTRPPLSTSSATSPTNGMFLPSASAYSSTSPPPRPLGSGSLGRSTSGPQRRHTIERTNGIAQVIPTSHSLPSQSQAQLHTPAHRLIAASVPLRSALRNRSPSPMPAGSTSTASLHSPSPSLPETRIVVPSAPGKVVLPPPSPSPPLPPAESKAARAEKLESDSASISSYETGHSQFEDAETETEAPAPPPKFVQAAMPPTPTKDLANGSPLQSAGMNGDALAVPGSDVLSASGSDVSTISGGTAGSGSGSGSGVARRKSVRVSLQPTFSPTPPAVEEEEEDGGEGERYLGAGEKGWSSRVREEGQKDVWEDSSSEDEEYAMARNALRKVGKKKW
ncbi:hypothetical protein OF83DRAFT_1139801 [Amylostereum chailletii]|nr:hypothetical protein OF83DRAFT_1139801 [Amylostereum chailletii]